MKEIDWIIDLTEEQKKNTKYILLYADEFDPDTWENYCKIVGESPRATVLRLQVCGSSAEHDEEEYDDEEDDEEDIKELILEGIENDIVKFIESPNDGCIACKIGEYWFYFIGMLDEDIKPSEIKYSYSDDELSELIYSAIIDLSEDEYNYYISYLKEKLI